MIFPVTPPCKQRSKVSVRSGRDELIHVVIDSYAIYLEALVRNSFNNQAVFELFFLILGVVVKLGKKKIQHHDINIKSSNS